MVGEHSWGVVSIYFTDVLVHTQTCLDEDTTIMRYIAWAFVS